ncbi:MAG: hypothetical protein WB765_18200 [Acidimicrobiales bacterium]
MNKALLGGLAAAALGVATVGTVAITHQAAGTGVAHPSPVRSQSLPASPQRPNVLVGDNPQDGHYLTDGAGRTLYIFTADHGNTSACTATCASSWPALMSTAPMGGPGVTASGLGTATGQVADQVTYDGRLLYRFAGDTEPGTMNGLAVPGWLLIAPNGAVLGSPASAPMPTPPATVTPPPMSSPPPMSPTPPPMSTPPSPMSTPPPSTPPAMQAPTPPMSMPPTIEAPPATNPIPQGGGGDGDADNNGGPDDGDGGV